jgi:predicted HicB family RNase H-like nuclease
LAQRTVAYKGYEGTIEVNTNDYSLYGKILFLDEEISYAGESFAELEDSFKKCVEEHIQSCKDKGEKPPFAE